MIRSKQKGFILVEVLIIIAVIGILAGVAIPKIGHSIALRELDNSARQLAGDIRLLEQMAENSNDGKEGGAGGVFIPAINFLKSSPFGYQILTNDGHKTTKYFPKSVRINANPSPITASVYDGKPDGITIGLESTKVIGALRFVIVEPRTGRVRVSDTE